MNKALLIDIFCTGQDGYGSLNNPFQANYQVFENGNLVLDKQIDINPKEDITWAAKSSLNVMPDRSRGVSLEDALAEIYDVMSKCRDEGAFLMGYNHMSYDIRILNDHFEKVLGKPRIEWPLDKTIDVMTLSQLTFPYREIGNYTVESCLSYIDMNLRGVREWHENRSCRADNAVTMKIYGKCCSDNNLDQKSYSDVATFIYMPREVVEMTFGKYKGMPLVNLLKEDYGYVSWLMRNDEIRNKNPNLVASLRKLIQTMD